MAEARKRMTWEPLSLFMAMFANSHRGKKTKAFRTSDFFPFFDDDEKSDFDSLPKADITDFKYLFSRDINWNK